MVVQRCHHCGNNVDREQEEAGAFIKLECLNNVHRLAPMIFHLSCWSSVAGDEYIEPFLKEIQYQVDNPRVEPEDQEWVGTDKAFGSNLQSTIGKPATKGTLASIKESVKNILNEVMPVGAIPKVKVIQGPGIGEVKVDVTLK